MLAVVMVVRRVVLYLLDDLLDVVCVMRLMLLPMRLLLLPLIHIATIPHHRTPPIPAGKHPRGIRHPILLLIPCRIDILPIVRHHMRMLLRERSIINLFVFLGKVGVDAVEGGGFLGLVGRRD